MDQRNCIKFCVKNEIECARAFECGIWRVYYEQNTSSAVVKRWPLILSFEYRNKKKSFGAKSGLYGGRLFKSMFWVLKNAVVWADVWELALSWWRVISLRRLVFLISWKTTGKQMVVYRSELIVLCCSSGTIAICSVCPKKQAIICLEVLRARATFVGFGLSWNTHTVDCYLLSGLNT